MFRGKLLPASASSVLPYHTTSTHAELWLAQLPHALAFATPCAPNLPLWREGCAQRSTNWVTATTRKVLPLHFILQSLQLKLIGRRTSSVCMHMPIKHGVWKHPYSCHTRIEVKPSEYNGKSMRQKLRLHYEDDVIIYMKILTPE